MRALGKVSYTYSHSTIKIPYLREIRLQKDAGDGEGIEMVEKMGIDDVVYL